MVEDVACPELSAAVRDRPVRRHEIFRCAAAGERLAIATRARDRVVARPRSQARSPPPTESERGDIGADHFISPCPVAALAATMSRCDCVSPGGAFFDAGRLACGRRGPVRPRAAPRWRRMRGRSISDKLPLFAKNHCETHRDPANQIVLRRPRSLRRRRKAGVRDPGTAEPPCRSPRRDRGQRAMDQGPQSELRHFRAPRSADDFDRRQACLLMETEERPRSCAIRISTASPPIPRRAR